MENIEMLIADLENLISSGKKAPFSANDVVLNRNYALEMVDRIKQSLPEIIKEAQYIKQENERIKADAISYAQKTVQQAEKRAEELLDQNEIIARAHRSDYKNRPSRGRESGNFFTFGRVKKPVFIKIRKHSRADGVA